MVCHWLKAFNERCMEVHHVSYLGRSSDLVNENLITTVCAILKKDHRVTISVLLFELVEKHFIDILRSTVHTIVHNELDPLKLNACWVLKNLTEEHQKVRMGMALDLLTLYHHEGETLFDRIVTGDEHGFIRI